MNQMQNPSERTVARSGIELGIPGPSTRHFLSEAQITTGSGIKNLLGEVIIPFKSRATTALITSRGDAIIGGEDRQLEIYKKGMSEPVRLNTHRMVTALFESPTSGRIFVGMNQGILAELVEDKLELNKSVLTVPTRKSWHTPWDKNDYDLHSFSETRGGRLFCAIHVGGVLVSEDKGSTWRQIQNGMDRIIRTEGGEFDIRQGAGLNPDVHQIKAHPTCENVLLAATRDGFYVSEDGGKTFEPRNGDIVETLGVKNYQRSLGIFPDKEIWLCATAEGPGALDTSRLLRSKDQGRSWKEVMGIPTPAPHIDSIECFRHGRAVALVGNSIFVSEDYGLNWSELVNAPKDFYTDRRHHVVRPLLPGVG